MEEKLVYSSTNTVEVDYICSILKENDIAFIRKTKGAGDYLTIAAGNLFNNTIKIFVSEKDYKKAIKLIDFINNANQKLQKIEFPDELKDLSMEEEKEMDERAKKTKRYLKLFIILFVFCPILIFIIIAIITSILQR